MKKSRCINTITTPIGVVMDYETKKNPVANLGFCVSSFYTFKRERNNSVYTISILHTFI